MPRRALDKTPAFAENRRIRSGERARVAPPKG
jgi:hypothetical protein